MVAQTKPCTFVCQTRLQMDLTYLSRVVRKPAYCLCENKDADQLRGDREADLRLCFRYTDSTTPLLSRSEISSLYSSSVVVQPGLCGTWSETPKTGFLRTRLIYSLISITIKGSIVMRIKGLSSCTDTISIRADCRP